jgi:hypothetical protein
MINETISVKGRVQVSLQRDDNTVWNDEIPNLVTTYGKSLIAERVFRDNLSNVANFGSIGVGNSDTAANVSDTELKGSRTITKTIASEFKSLDGNKMLFTVTFLDNDADTLGETGTPDEIKEVGLFSSTGDLICRTVLTSPFTKTETDLLSVTWTLEIG